MRLLAAVDSGPTSGFLPPAEHQVLVFLAQLAVILVLARLLGQLMRSIGQPAVIGELAAGLILGPSALGVVAPDVYGWLFPSDAVQSAMLFSVGWLGVLLLLVITGFEIDLRLIRKLGRAAGWVSVSSLVVPMAFGFAVGLAMPVLFLGEADDRLFFALFMGVALSISSLPVVAKVLTELGLMRRNFAQLTMAVATVNDVVGWILLGLIAGLVQSGTLSLSDLGTTLGALAGFLVLAFTVGQVVVNGVFRRLQRRQSGQAAGVAFIVILALVAGVATQAIGVEAVLGTFVVGMLVGRSNFRQREAERHLETATLSVFAPLFFATAGLRVDLSLLNERDVLVWSLVVVGVASISKFLGAILGGMKSHLAFRESAALGVGLNARGALEIVVAAVGLSLGILNRASYSVVVLMAMATSIMAPPMLRALTRGWRGSTEEQQRLDQEEKLDRNVFLRPEKVLLASRGLSRSLTAARILDLAWPSGGKISVISVSSGKPSDMQEVRSVFTRHDAKMQKVRGKDVVQTLRKQASLGYSALTLGADKGSQIDTHLVSCLADGLLAAVDIPMVIVRQGVGVQKPPFEGLVRRIVVPVSGTVASRAAQEFAFSLASNVRAEVQLLHVVTSSSGATERRWRPGNLYAPEREQPDVVHRLMRTAEGLAGESGANTQSFIRESGTPANSIIGLALERDAEMIVLGAEVRVAEGRPFLGHNAEGVIREAPCTVVVIANPSKPRA